MCLDTLNPFVLCLFNFICQFQRGIVRWALIVTEEDILLSSPKPTLKRLEYNEVHLT